MIAGGEGGEPVVVAHKPEDSFLIDLVTLQEGDDRPEMPEKDEPLTPYELALVTKWIEQGARDDTPENARQRFDADHPPQYAVAPVLTSLDYSPDGELIAVAGFHEVLLHKADGSGLVARLIGLSERIETARFSPDGKLLAIAGGPARAHGGNPDLGCGKAFLDALQTGGVRHGLRRQLVPGWEIRGLRIAGSNFAGHRGLQRGRNILHGQSHRLGPRHGLVGRRGSSGIGGSRHVGQADRGGDGTVYRQHHLHYSGCAQGRDQCDQSPSP